MSCCRDGCKLRRGVGAGLPRRARWPSSSLCLEVLRPAPHAAQLAINCVCLRQNQSLHLHQCTTTIIPPSDTTADAPPSVRLPAAINPHLPRAHRYSTPSRWRKFPSRPSTGTPSSCAHDPRPCLSSPLVSFPEPQTSPADHGAPMPRRSYWILIPITVVMVLTGVLRHYASVLMATAPKKLEARALREQRALARGVALRSNYHALSQRAFEARREGLTAGYESGAFLKEPERKGQPPANPLTDPSQMDGMMGMMKNNMAMIIPNTLIMSWINAFFSGYVISASSSPAAGGISSLPRACVLTPS